MAGILDVVIAIAWIWFYLVAVLAGLSVALVIVALLVSGPSKNQSEPIRRVKARERKIPDTRRRSKLTADLL